MACACEPQAQDLKDQVKVWGRIEGNDGDQGLGEDVMKFFSVLVAVKLTPLLVPHLPVGEGSWDLVSFLLMSEIWKANYTFCFRGSAPWLHM